MAVEEGWGTTEIFEVECKHLEELTTVAQAVGARFNMKISTQLHRKTSRLSSRWSMKSLVMDSLVPRLT